jgi:NADH-quinone oxidoreductase subunit A
MAHDFVPVLILMGIAAAIAIVLPVLSSLLGRRRSNPVKDATYECGVAELDSARKRTPIRFYMVALTFLVFDIEIAFLYPWAVALKRLDPKVFVLAQMAIFLGVILVAFAWEWKKGALEWD